MKKNMKIIDIAIGLFVILATSCDKKTTITPDALSKEWYVSQMLESNDRNASIYAYNEYCFYYPNDIDIIPFSLYMANQYNYGLACFKIFYEINSVFERELITIDSATQEFILYYLKKGVDLNDTDCMFQMSTLYTSGTFVEKDTVMAKKYLLRICRSDKVYNILWSEMKKQYYKEEIP